MSNWDHRIRQDVRFADQDRSYDQEFGKPLNDELNDSSYTRSRTTFHKTTFERVDGNDTYFHSERNDNQRTLTPGREPSQSKSRSPPRKREETKEKPKKPVEEGKFIGHEVKRELAKAAELKLGTKIYRPESLFDFWNNQIKERPSKKQEFSASLNKPPRPSTAVSKTASEKASSSAPKSKKAQELQGIYDKYKNSKAADIKKTLQVIDKDDQDKKERVEGEKKEMMDKANNQQREAAVRKEITNFLKRYMDKKTYDAVIELDEKQNDIRLIKEMRTRTRSKSRSKSPQRQPRSGRRQGTKSPIQLEGSLGEIEESKAESIAEESIAKTMKISKSKAEKSEKTNLDDLEKKYSDDEIDNFDYKIERTRIEETLKICGKVYAQTVFQSRDSKYKFTNDGAQLLSIYKDKRTGTHAKHLSEVFKNYYKDESRNYLMEARDFIEKSLKEYFDSDKEFMDRVLLNYEKDTAPRLRSNEKVIVYYDTLNTDKKKRRILHRKDGGQIIKDYVAQENEKVKKEEEKEVKKEEKKQELLKRLTKEIAKDFKDPDVKAHTLDELAQPKDKWRKGKKLLELKKKFPHDLILQRMAKDEFKENRVFKYPEEYEIYDDEEEEKRKMPKYKPKEYHDQEANQKKMLETFMQKEKQREQQNQIEEDQRKEDLKQFKKSMKQEVDTYISDAKKRLTSKRHKGQKETLADIYHRLKAKHSKIVEEKFPNPLYGIKKGSKAEMLSFPQQFKFEFYELYRKVKKMGRANSTRPAYFVPGGVSHDTHNAKIKLGEDNMKKYEKNPPNIKTRVWKRDDYLNDMHEIMMTNDDAENCTFEPNAGSQNLHMQKILDTFPEFQREEYDKEKDLNDFVKKLGDGFKNSNPEIFKGGILRAARAKFNEGRLAEAMNKLSEGFKFTSLKREYEPGYMLRQMFQKKNFIDVKKVVEDEEKNEEDKEAKQEDDKKKEDAKKEDTKRDDRHLSDSELARKEREQKRKQAEEDRAAKRKKEEEEKQAEKLKAAKKKMNEVKPYEEKYPEQKNMHEEQFEKPKLKPILDEAYRLLVAIETAQVEKRKEKLKFKKLVRTRNKELEKTIKEKEIEHKKNKTERAKKEKEDLKKREQENELLERKQKRIEAKLDKQEEQRKKKMAVKLKEEKKDIKKLVEIHKKHRPHSTHTRKKFNKDLQ